MALRVLLADENVTIKKVIQLSLSDYAVSVKSVNLGIDVLEVARGFKPDIVFADILLQKRNGYEVCQDFKRDAELSDIPIVLLWSGFMELDRQRYQECGADGELEKPFDKDTLRDLVQQLVSKTQDNPLSQHIDLPKTPVMKATPPPGIPPLRPLPAEPSEEVDEEEDFKVVTPGSGPNTSPINPAQPTSSPSIESQSPSTWSMESFDEIEDFVQHPLSDIEQEENSLGHQSYGTLTDSDDEDEEEWVQQPINKPSPKNIGFTAPPPIPPVSSPAKSTASAPNWSKGDLSEFQLNVPMEDGLEEILPEEFESQFNLDALNDDVPTSSFLATDEPAPDKFAEEHTEDYVPDNSPPPKFDLSQKFSEEDLEEILRSQSRELIESVVWKVVPDLAEKIIREELEKIMRESDA